MTGGQFEPAGVGAWRAGLCAPPHAHQGGAGFRRCCRWTACLSV